MYKYHIDFERLKMQLLEYSRMKDEYMVTHLNNMIDVVISDHIGTVRDIAEETLKNMGILVLSEKSDCESSELDDDLNSRLVLLEDMVLGFNPEMKDEILKEIPMEYIPVWNSFSNTYKNQVYLIRKVLNLSGESADNFWKIIFN